MLEEYLQAFKGCVIVVSHDRYFVDKVAEHLLGAFCGNGDVREFPGNYSDYIEWKHAYEAAKQAAAAQERSKASPDSACTPEKLRPQTHLPGETRAGGA